MKKIQDVNLKWGLGILGSFLFLLLVQLSAAHVAGESLTIKGIERDPSLDTSGTSYGELHDRKDLGKIMTKDSQLTISSSEETTLWLLTNDKKTEKSYTISSNEQIIKIDTDATPFITSPRNDSTITVEYEFSGTTTDLPIYHKNDNVQEFLNQWEESKVSYGLMIGERFQLYLPYQTLDLIKNMDELEEGFKDIPDLMHFYDEELFPLYNQLSGLPLNQNRFFLKADEHGAGGAYYNDNWAADSTPSGKMWLQNTWGVKHEIGHGFQNNLMRQMGMSEISNNIFGSYYDYHVYYGRDGDEKSWLFKEKGKDYWDSELSDKLAEGQTFTDMGATSDGYREKLILVYTLFDRLGAEGITKMNVAARNPELGSLFTANSEILYNYLSKIGQEFGLDFNKIMQDYGYIVNSESYFYQNELSLNTSVVDSVGQLVSEENLDGVIDKLWENDANRTSRTRFNLVTPQELSVTGLKSDINVEFSNKAPSSLIGTEAVLYDGDKKIATKLIDNVDSVTFENIPLGTYRIKFISNDERFFVNNPYVSSNQKGKLSQIKFEKEKKSTLLAYNTFSFLGLSNKEFMVVNTMPNPKFNGAMIDINFFKDEPHTNFSGELYAGIEIEGVNNENEQVSFEKMINGDSLDVFDKKLLVNLEDDKITEIKTTHVEADDPDAQRLFVRNIIGEELSDFDHLEANFILKENGLVNLLNQGGIEAKIERMVIKIGDSYLENKDYLIGDKLSNDLYWLIKQLPEDKESTYLEKYDSVL